MPVNKIPLEERLERIQKNWSSDPEFDALAIRAMSNIPMKAYLTSFPEEQVRLADIFDISIKKLEQMPYKDVAERISDMWSAEHVTEAMVILTQPFIKCWEDRRHLYE